MAHCFLLSVLVLTLSSCAAWQDLSMTAGHPASPGLPTGLQTGLSLAVWLEDHCEDSETDGEIWTLLELAHDALVVPPQNLMAFTLAIVVGLPWSLYDSAALPRGAVRPNRFTQVLDLAKPRFAGPQLGANQPRFLAAFSARFSMSVLAGFFLVSFFCCMPLAIAFLL